MSKGYEITSYKIVQHPSKIFLLFFPPSSTIITSGKFGLPLVLLVDPFPDPREGAPEEGADS